MLEHHIFSASATKMSINLTKVPSTVPLRPEMVNRTSQSSSQRLVAKFFNQRMDGGLGIYNWNQQIEENHVNFAYQQH